MRPECISVRALSANEGSGTADWPLVEPLACLPDEAKDIADHFLGMQRRPRLCVRPFLRSPTGLHQRRQFLLGRGAHGTANGGLLRWGLALPCLGADFPLHFAHRCFIASEIRLRAAALIVRRFPPFGGRPRLGTDEVSPSRAEMAWSRRLRSALNSETRFWMPIESFAVRQAAHIVAVSS